MRLTKAIVVKGVSKKYKLYSGMKERLFDLISPSEYGESFYALSNVDFEAEHGEVVGFIGINGSGKSTLSNIISGIVPQTAGTVEINGEVALIAVAAGLKNDLTGRDNIELKLLMLGFSRKKIKELEQKIIEFSELGKFIDQPVKSYSSGMKSRLGFSISVNVDPEILIIDEALSVGDKAFAEKSLKKMREFKGRGKTMIFVSHSIGQMKQFCDKILWLEFGMVKDYGPVAEIIPKYEDFLKKWQVMNKNERENYRKAAFENQQKALRGETIQNHLDIDDYYSKEKMTDFIERPVSMLGHFKGGESFIYKSPSNLTEAVNSHSYKHKVYYIRKQSSNEEDLFYLLSEEPSGIKGIIGWVHVANLSIHQHIIVDFDEKEFIMNGNGKAFDRPWGGKENCIFKNLKSHANQKFIVSETDFVGNNIWYKGKLEDKEVWVHNSAVDPIEE
ncbi:teichoic acids export ABC transporter ATP-binding subunit TagH [Ornithinibacillus sp. 4-3]|uniref:Teichoic acids export ABC transporter ATP-binding subunit TagH n=1 Tax=Ornithinibacillus sp. 4-3 TaxID=3231488 RepID=A0AB39HPK7_9BACI